ncbi:MAG: hypothetical protein ISS25_01995 [Nanoarchaeota archaeon]|nr:hypothetical protein [DPANN group archaeon]MBL7116578.1 hypothetical protein [Nanoarchaeota archaeon]
MTNINIEISDDIHKQIKLKAVLEDLTIKDYIIKSLEKKFSHKKIT